MLSYRHSFHAGNFADLLKHIVMVEILEHLTKKDKPFEYIDTHSGAGLYNLTSTHSEKLAEFNNGIGKLKAEDWPELARYFAAINEHNPANTLKYYPGSPLIAMQFLRKKDNAWLYELHPSDCALLIKNTQSNRRVRTKCEDGTKGLLSLLPPVSRRALILIDPSYEMKSDYELVFKTLQQAVKKFATGTYALWYPVVERQKIQLLEKRLIKSGIKNIQRFELGLSPDTEGRGMTSSGMIVINPPWGLFEKMSNLLPKLAKVIDEGEGAVYQCDVLVDE